MKLERSRILLSALIFGLFSNSVVSGECSGRFARIQFGGGLEQHFAKSVFSYRGGTAYFIGGSPGYFITAKHVIDQSASSKNELCSNFHSRCYQVSISGELEDHDLALLRLEEPLPKSVASLDLAFTELYRSNMELVIFGYGRSSESSERTWSTSPGTYRQRSKVDTSHTAIPIKTAVYHLNIPQYPGASGGPVIGETGQVWGTAVKSINSNQQAYGIPHDSVEFVQWVLDNTSPSDEAQDFIEAAQKSESDQLFLDKFVRAMDIRVRTLSNLDVLHIANYLVRNDTQLFFQTMLCPLSASMAYSIDWRTLIKVGEFVFTALDQTYVYELAAEHAWNVGSESSDSHYRSAMLASSGSYRLSAVETMAAHMKGIYADWYLEQLEIFSEDEITDNYLSAVGGWFVDESVPKELLIYTRATSFQVDKETQIYKRFMRNLYEATKTFNLAYEITRDFEFQKQAVVSSSMLVSLHSFQLEAENKSDRRPIRVPAGIVIPTQGLGPIPDNAINRYNEILTATATPDERRKYLFESSSTLLSAPNSSAPN